MATPCPYLGPAAAYCPSSKPSVTTPTTPSVSVTTDPLTSLAHSVAHGAAWTVTRLGAILDRGAGSVDFTNRGFVAQYAITFAAALFLTLVLWLIAVAK